MLIWTLNFQFVLIHFSLIVKLRFNPCLKLTSAEYRGYCFLFKETIQDFD